MRILSRIAGIPSALRFAMRRRRAPLLVVHIQETGLREHVEPVIQWLLDHDDCQILIVVRAAQYAAFRSDSSLPLTSPRVELVTEERFVFFLYDAGAVLSLHPESPSAVACDYKWRSKTYRVVMQHGLPDKESFYVADGRGDTLSCYEGVFLIGPSAREGSLRQYAEHYPEQFARLRFFEIGYPKVDELYRASFDRSAFLRIAGLDPSRPTICYAPTYQRTASLESRGVAIIRALATLDANVLVKLHHVSLKRPGPDLEDWVRAEIGERDWRAEMARLEAELPNVRLARVQSANPCLLASDVLVTDVSGVAFEYLVLDRPIVFFDVPELFAATGTVGIHYWGRSCGDIVQTIDQLLETARAALRDPARGQQDRQRLRSRLLYNPGAGAESAGRTLSALLRAGVRR